MAYQNNKFTNYRWVVIMILPSLIPILTNSGDTESEHEGIIISVIK